MQGGTLTIRELSYHGRYGKGTSQALVYLDDGCAITFTVFLLAVGAKRGTHLLSRGVEPHVQWQWRSGCERVTDEEVAGAVSAAVRYLGERQDAGTLQ